MKNTTSCRMEFPPRFFGPDFFHRPFFCARPWEACPKIFFKSNRDTPPGPGRYQIRNLGDGLGLQGAALQRVGCIAHRTLPPPSISQSPGMEPERQAAKPPQTAAQRVLSLAVPGMPDESQPLPYVSAPMPEHGTGCGNETTQGKPP